jgi:hypothetical protein
MADKSPKAINVTFVGLGADEQPPATALYRYAAEGKPPEKLGRVEGGKLNVDPAKLKGAEVALGPDVGEAATLDPATLVRFRGDQVADEWLRRGLLIPADRWNRFLQEIICVSGRVRKCRPWWYEIAVLERATVSAPSRIRAKLGIERRAVPAVAADLSASSIALPWRCLSLCDGRVEVFERVCCCPYIVYDDLIDRLRDILDDLPIEVNFPDPPIPDPGPLAQRAPRLRRAAPAAGRDAASVAGADLSRTTVSERVYRDYAALLQTPRDQVAAFVEARPYLSAYICTCTMRKVGETFIRPNGEFDFCYWRPRHFHSLHRRCYTTFAYRVRQFIDGMWVTVYDGVAGHDYFAAGEEAVLTTSNPKARPCGDGPTPPDPGDGTPFVMLEHVTGPATHHFNFPTQTALSNVGPLGVDSGLYDFAGVPDCPWATSLGLRLWVSRELEGIVSFYRFKTVPVNAAGDPVGTPTILKPPAEQPTIWSRFVSVPGDVIVVSDSLEVDASTVGGEEGLCRVPYWSGGMNWLSGQFHRQWNTAGYADGKYMLILELFGPGGARIKPNGSPAGDPGTARPFQFRRWEAPDDTANVPFGDCAHIFWINNTPVEGDIVDLRRNGTPSTDECQFMSGPASTTFSAGFRAYHENGVTTGGGAGDTNSFMARYTLTWQRGLNGPYGTLETGTADQGELAVEQSNTMSFGTLLGPWWSPPSPPAPVPPPPPPGGPPTWPAHTRCSFSIHLHVDAKHHNGGSFIDAYDYRETASFALEITS